jgi:uncharacterized LabA/DUF88 family protein
MASAHGQVHVGEAAAVLIDADNLSSSAIEQVFTHLAHQGLHVSTRRAYGGHEKLVAMRDCLLRHGIRALVNNGKGTTDALLVVDAMDLLHAGRLPSVVAIASSDADFAPLALRLREAGHRVICFAQAGKSADSDLARGYDQLVSFDGAHNVHAEAHAHAPAPAPAPAKSRARASASRKRASPAKAAPAAPVPPPPPAEPPPSHDGGEPQPGARRHRRRSR